MLVGAQGAAATQPVEACKPVHILPSLCQRFKAFRRPVAACNNDGGTMKTVAVTVHSRVAAHMSHSTQTLTLWLSSAAKQPGTQAQRRSVFRSVYRNSRQVYVHRPRLGGVKGRCRERARHLDGQVLHEQVANGAGEGQLHLAHANLGAQQTLGTQVQCCGVSSLWGFRVGACAPRPAGASGHMFAP